MQERSVLLLVVVLVSATAGAGVAVNAFHYTGPAVWHSFYVTVDHSGTPVVGSPLNISVTVRQGTVDPKTLWAVYLSLDMGPLSILRSTPGTNPWGYPTVWNLTSLDLTAPKLFTATGVAAANGTVVVSAMIWVPQGDLNSVSVDAQGHVNPAGISLMTVQTDAFWVNATA